MEEQQNNREAAWDCRFYENETKCKILIKMTCKEKDCKWYRNIHGNTEPQKGGATDTNVGNKIEKGGVQE